MGKRVSHGDFFADFDVELVGGVFGLPVAAVEVEFVTQDAIGTDGFSADFGGELRHQVPIGLLAGGGEQVLEGGTGGAFVDDFVGGVAAEVFVVAADLFVRGFEAMGKGHSCVTRPAGARIRSLVR